MALGVEPHGADNSQHQIDKEEQGESQTAVHLLRAALVEFLLLQMLFKCHQASDAVEARLTVVDEFAPMFLYEALGIHPLLQSDYVAAFGFAQTVGSDD